MKKGDRVHLRSELAESLMRGGERGGLKRSHLNWRDRHGTVATSSRRDQVAVLWDGRRTVESWPVRGLELDEETST